MSARQGDCAQCGRTFPLHLLDAKPARLAGANNTRERIAAALEQNEDFNRLECEGCYGPGFVAGKPS